MRAELDSRSQGILRRAVSTFIASGEPVGSRTLAKLSPYGLSPATIRIVMAELEELGYLFQPHTSAGRMPTDKGYRFYVDTATRPATLSRSERERIGTELRRGGANVPDLMQVSSHLLAELADTVSFVIAPVFEEARLQQVDLVRLSERRILVVLVSDTGQVTSRVIEVEKDYTRDEIARAARYLSVEFRGATLAEARELLLARMQEERASFDQIMRAALTLGQIAFAEEHPGAGVYLEGTARVLKKPEFATNVDRARQLLETLEEKNRLVELLSACLDGDGLQIVIGSEAPVDDFKHLALIAARYRCGDREVGSLGIVGPTRLEYAKVISVVSHIAKSLSSAMSGLDGSRSAH